MTKDEYWAFANGFRSRMLAEIEKPENEQCLPDPDEWPSLDVLVTCHTPGCPVEGMTTWANVSEPIDGVYRVICGRCQKTVTDIDPMLEDDEDFRLNVRLPNGNFGVVGS